MRMRFNPRWLLISALLFSLQLCWGQAPSGTFSYDLGGSDSPESRLWDLSGTYQLDLTVVKHDGTEVPLSLGFNLAQDAAGKLSGPTNDIQFLEVFDDGVFAVNYAISGKVTGAFGTARARFAIVFAGNGQLAGRQDVAVTGIITVDAQTDPDSGQLVGVKLTRVTANFSGLGSLNGTVQSFNVSTPLPAGVDGTWNLSLNIAPLSSLVGTATITTPSKKVGFDLTGKFKGGTSKIKILGAADVVDTTSGFGSTATILLFSFDNSISVKGKLLGQKVQFGFPPLD